MRAGETWAEMMRRHDERAARLEAADNYVYRALDSYGLLLYIGCSANVMRRMGGHRNQDWYPYMETLAISGPWRRSEAMRREREAIETEAPYFNSPMSNMRLANMSDPRARRLYVSWPQRLERYLADRDAAIRAFHGAA